jgi:hypothetical protein
MIGIPIGDRAGACVPSRELGRHIEAESVARAEIVDPHATVRCPGVPLRVRGPGGRAVIPLPQDDHPARAPLVPVLAPLG